MAQRDWHEWHAAYDNPGSGLARRLAWVQDQVRAALDAAPAGPVRVISLCAGQGRDLIGALAQRRQAIVDLLANTTALSRQLSKLIADNEKQLAPALERLNSVTAMLEKNRDNIGKALPGLAKYQITQGETVANGYYYSAFVPDLFVPQLLQPFFDYYFGFRRGATPGQPPGNAGPRAEFPLPYNGILGGSR